MGVVFDYGTLSDLFLLAVSVVYILLAPFTKVEESFNVQATHDFLYNWYKPAASNHSSLSSLSPFAFNLDGFDHFDFPGVVPRSSLGALVLALCAFPFKIMLTGGKGKGVPKIALLVVSRVVLAAFNVWAMRQFRIALGKAYGVRGKRIGLVFVLLTATQFHLPFYLGRMLPNMFAFGLITWAHSFYLVRDYTRYIFWMVFATVVFRCDTLVLLAPEGLTLLLTREISIGRALVLGIGSGVISLVVTVALDSFFWRTMPMWPEGTVLFFNTVLNKSSDWGTQPWHWYFSSAFVRSMLAGLPFLPLGFLSLTPTKSPTFHLSTSGISLPLLPFPPSLSRHFSGLRVTPSTRTLRLFVPVVVYVSLYSLLPHKELRFIFPGVVLMNAVAARGLVVFTEMVESLIGGPDVMRERKAKTEPAGEGFRTDDGIAKGKERRKEERTARHGEKIKKTWVLFSTVGLVFLVNVALTSIFLIASVYNYPGGWALKRLHGSSWGFRSIDKAPLSDGFRGSLHIDVKSAMTGVSRFLQQQPQHSATESDPHSKQEKEAESGGKRQRTKGERAVVQWVYSKDEDISTPEAFESFTHLIVDSGTARDSDRHGKDWKVAFTENEFAGIGTSLRAMKSCFHKQRYSEEEGRKGVLSRMVYRCLLNEEIWTRPGITVLVRKGITLE